MVKKINFPLQPASPFVDWEATAAVVLAAAAAMTTKWRGMTVTVLVLTFSLFINHGKQQCTEKQKITVEKCNKRSQSEKYPSVSYFSLCILSAHRLCTR